MEYGSIAGISGPVSRLLLGTAGDGFQRGEDQSALLDAALSLGINTLDTARQYGKSEQVIGRWLQKRDCRDQVVILSKGAHPTALGRKRVSEKEIRKDWQLSAEALGVERIDLYLLHRDDPSVPVGDIVEILNALRAEGKISAFGGSNWTHTRIQAANDYAAAHGLTPFTVSSPQFSLAAQQRDPWGGGCVTLSGPENSAARAWYMASRMPVIAYSSLGRGLLTGKIRSSEQAQAAQKLDKFAVKAFACNENYARLRRCEELAAQKQCTVAQIAMAWLLRQPLETYAVATMSSPRRLEENIGALQVSLSEEECRYLDQGEQTA